MKKLSEYTSGIPENRHVILYCEKCKCNRHAILDKDYPGEDILERSQLNDYTAKCLFCGTEYNDPYNWWK